MTTKAELIARFETQYPTLQVGNDEDGYTNLDSGAYGATIAAWADSALAQLEADAATAATAAAKASGLAKLANLGFTAEEIAAW
jgi:hypothetical protein